MMEARRRELLSEENGYWRKRMAQEMQQRALTGEADVKIGVGHLTGFVTHALGILVSYKTERMQEAFAIAIYFQAIQVCAHGSFFSCYRILVWYSIGVVQYLYVTQ